MTRGPPVNFRFRKFGTPLSRFQTEKICSLTPKTFPHKSPRDELSQRLYHLLPKTAERFRCSDSKKRAKTTRKPPKPSHLRPKSARKEKPPEANVFKAFGGFHIQGY